MKKPVLAVLAVFAAACTGTGTDNKVKPMNIQIENEYGTALVSWEKPEEKELPAFEERLAAAIKDSMKAGKTEPADVSLLTWERIARIVLGD